MVVTRVALRDFRSYPGEELELKPGLVLVAGPNGAGKTNLLEAVHLGTQGFSFRTRRDAAAVRFGARFACVELGGESRPGAPFATRVTVDSAGGKRMALNGAAVQSQEELRCSLPVLAFTPDRLVVVKGPPAARRAYLDRATGRLWPARADLPAEYAAALTQRNAALRRVRAGAASLASLAAWDVLLVRLASALDAAREEAVERLAPLFVEEALRLGLPAGGLAYRRSGLSEEALSARLERDLERGATGAGPHLEDVAITSAGLDLRAYGSQGQQRAAVLALLLAEARALAAARGEPPLLLLDDVLSELDDRRRTLLLAGIPAACQVVVTATTDGALPAAVRKPDQIVDVAPGRARPR